MNKRKKHSFEELVKKNKLELLRDQAAIEQIEERLEKKYLSKAE
ncbi:FbpB family small basic protein [Bacillus sp. V3B]|nr:FbpB family small basic protein [Bacillus sp. V3B]MCQ6277447.1 FbpB family small basic protein [Bacillus sp. V3B]